MADGGGAVGVQGARARVWNMHRARRVPVSGEDAKRKREDPHPPKTAHPFARIALRQERLRRLFDLCKLFLEYLYAARVTRQIIGISVVLIIKDKLLIHMFSNGMLVSFLAVFFSI